MITIKDYFMGRDISHKEEITDQIRINATKLLEKINPLLESYGKVRVLTSGWRPPSVNATIPGAAAKSKHMTGDAVDIADADGSLKRWCLENLDKLSDLGLYMEHPSATPTWCHLQQIPPRSGNRVFKP